MRNQTNYYRCVGIKDGNLYMVDYTFEDTMHGKPFRGVTGTVFVPLTQDEIDERNDLDNVIGMYGYLWEEAVANGQTEESQQEYMQQMIDHELNFGGGLFLGHDVSYIHKIPEELASTYFPGAVSFECVGGGRCFDADMVFDVVLDEALLEEIRRLERAETA